MERLALRLAEPAKILIVIGIAYSLAQAGWYFVSGPQPQPLGDATHASQPNARPAPMSVGEIIDQNLFGTADAAATQTVPDESPPDTRLRLTLEGVFRADDPALSAAIVAEQGRTGELYSVGATLPGNAVLTEVHTDRIIFRRGASYETLRFSEETSLISADQQPDASGARRRASRGRRTGDDDASDTQSHSNSGSDDPGADVRSLDEVVAEYKDRLDSDPEGTLSSLGLAPVAASDAQGYRLGNLSQSPYLSQTGLQPGDVILSINGSPVGNVRQDQLQIDNIMAQGSARLEVQRGARRFFVTASLR